VNGVTSLRGRYRQRNRASAFVATILVLAALPVLSAGAPGPFSAAHADAPDTAGTCTSGAALTASPSTGEAPLIVNFILTIPSGTGTPHYSWNFGDGAYWNGSGVGYSDPSHLYLSSGFFEVTVLASVGSSQYHCSVEVEPYGRVPSVGITATPTSGTAPMAVRFLAEAFGGSGTYESFNWSFGDGAVGTGIEVNHTYGNSGVYLVRLSVLDSNGTRGSTTIQVSVLAPGIPLWLVALLVGSIAVLLLVLLVALRRLSRLRRMSREQELMESVPLGVGPRPSPTDGTGIGSTPTLVLSPARETGQRDSRVIAARPPEELLRVSQRIVRHIAAQGALRGDEVASRAFTQAGIQAAVGVSRSSVSNALRRLERARILLSDVRHVHGEPRRLRVYTLTDLGWALASDLPRRPR